ncbi:hypothetical protein [Arthrobacter sp. NEB 688]|uniref:hypothetical protein n=1 Tax=Arthrobacter sp. NEB 688 TaxID=904039 RepID=UPI0015670903|nr:hypothetical protein [Arthrobacter sp. NEB 688]QKE85378.1 hypothetical protein HL663_16510 [Arthrobacter sp. NEB 688]
MSGRPATARHGSTRGTRTADASGLTARTLALRALSSARAPAVVLALLAAVTAAYLVATPRAAFVATDAAVGDTVAAARAQAREVGVRAPAAPSFDVPAPSETPGDGPTAPFASVDEAVRSVLGPVVGRVLATPTWAAQSGSTTLTRTDGATLRPDGSRAVVRVQSALGAHVRWTSGAAPGAPTGTRSLAPVLRGHVTAEVPVALADATARFWGVRAGDRLVVQPGDRLLPLAVVVTGTFEPLDPTDGFWQAEPRMTGLARIATAQGGVVTEGAVVADAASYGAVSDGMARPVEGVVVGGDSTVLSASWRYPLDAARLRAADVRPLREALVRLDTDSRLDRPGLSVLEVSTGLASVLDDYEASVRATGVMTTFATAGLTALTVLVLSLTAVVAVARRRAEVALVRARGGSLRQVVAQVVGGSALPALAAAALGALAALLLVPGRTGATSWLEVVVVSLVPALAGATAVLLRVRAVERDDSSEEAVRRGRVVRAARRVVAELAVVALAAAAVATVRGRGREIAAGSTDWWAALAPALVAAVAALLVLRLLPVPVRVLARLASRRRGLVAFVGLARAARTGASAALPVLAVVVGAALLGLLASLTLAVGEQRDVAAHRQVGADVRVDAVRMGDDDVRALATRPGVRAVVPAYVADATVSSGSRAVPVVLVAADPAAYAALVADTPVAVRTPPSAPGQGLAAVVGPGVPVGGGAEVVVRGERIRLGDRVVDPGLERLVAGRQVPAVLVSLDRLRELAPATTAQTAFVAADAGAARALTGLRDPGAATPSGRVGAVDSVDAARDRVGERALSRLVTLTYSVGALLAALLTLLAVALLLVATRPDRAALVIRLRTMGLPHGLERHLAWTEVLPVVAVAAVAGAVAGALAPALVGPAVDLAPFTGSAPFPPVAASVPAALGAALLVLVLGALALVLDAAATRRGHLADHLRTGDTA